MRKNIIDHLEEHTKTIKENLENPEETLRGIENLILDLEQMHYAISVLVDPPKECEAYLMEHDYPTYRLMKETLTYFSRYESACSSATEIDYNTKQEELWKDISASIPDRTYFESLGFDFSTPEARWSSEVTYRVQIWTEDNDWEEVCTFTPYS